MQILDAGRLTDGQGRTVNFKNTVIIMTSNIGQEIFHSANSIGFKAGRDNTAYVDVKEKLLEAVKKSFRPEFLNRIDDIVVFNPISKEGIRKILEIELEPLYKKLAQREIQLEITQKAKEYLCEKGFDVNFGARPLKRTIQKYIQDPLSIKILSGSVKEGDKVVVDKALCNLEIR